MNNFKYVSSTRDAYYFAPKTTAMETLLLIKKIILFARIQICIIIIMNIKYMHFYSKDIVKSSKALEVWQNSSKGLTVKFTNHFRLAVIAAQTQLETVIAVDCCDGNRNILER